MLEQLQKIKIAIQVLEHYESRADLFGYTESDISSLKNAKAIIEGEYAHQADQLAHSEVTIEMEEAEKEPELIPLKEWAIREGITPATARQKALRGSLTSAKKAGRDWMISKYEKNSDKRFRDEN